MPKKAKARKKRGTMALRSAAEALQYEWWMTHVTMGQMAHAKKAGDQALVNSALESFLIHVRNISDFFRVRRREEDDVLARDYLGRTPRVKLPYIRKNKKRLHRRIAHLSYSRSRLGRGWQTERMQKETDGAMKVFQDNLRARGKRALPRIIQI